MPRLKKDDMHAEGLEKGNHKSAGASALGKKGRGCGKHTCADHAHAGSSSGADLQLG